MSLYTGIVWAPVLFAAGLAVSRPFTRRSACGLIAGLAVLAGGVLLHIDGLPAVAYLRAVLAEPSMGLVVICLVYGIRSLAAHGTGCRTAPLHVTVLILSLGLYPLSLGVGWFDPYALGYQRVFALGLLIVALVLWWTPGTGILAVWLTLAILTHRTGLGESDNLWDFLIDPIIVMIAIGWTTGCLVRAIGGRFVKD